MSAEGAEWVGYNNRLRTGIYWAGERNPTQADPSYPVTIEMWAQTNYTSYNNDLTINYSGNWGNGSNVVRATNSNPTLMAGPGRVVFTASYDGEQTFRNDMTVSGPSAGPSSISRVGVIPRRPTANPDTPRDLSTSNRTGTAATINFGGPAEAGWRGPVAGRSYVLQVSARSDFATLVTQVGVSGPYRVTGLQPNTQYFYRLKCRGTWWDATRESVWTATSTFATLTGIPGVVTGRSTTDITATGFRANWLEPAPNNGGSITKYQIEVRDSSDPTTRNGTVLVNQEITARNPLFGSLQNYHDYVWHVRAYNGSAWGPWQVDDGLTGMLVKTLALAPVLASTPAATAVGRTSFQVPTAPITNNGGQAPTGYRAQVSTTASETGATIFTQASWAPVSVTGRAPLTTYFYRVSAQNSAGWGAWTEWRSVSTLNSAPDDPDAPTITNITETQAQVQWTAPALNGTTLSGYTLVISATGSPEAPVKTLPLGPSDTVIVVTGLVKGTTYQAFVRANATPSNSGWSAPGEFRTLGDRSTLIPYINDNGIWRRVQFFQRDDAGWNRNLLNLNDAGVWKREEA